MFLRRINFACLACTFLACLFVPSVHAAYSSLSELHISNLQISAPSGSLIWTYGPSLNIASASIFDEPSGWVQSYDDDPGASGQASASATAVYGANSAFASANQGKIDVVSTISNPTNAFVSLTDLAFGEIYNLFAVNGNDPVQATFSLDWTAQLSGQTTTDTFALVYALQLLVSDGINNHSREAYSILPIKGTQQSFNNAGSFYLDVLLQPNTAYSLDVFGQVDPAQYVPEPSSLSLFLVAAALVRKFSRSKR
ncbi:MAG: hypothetical protein NTX45_28385 [Proteobacteria bacterium]|nr:hypothetical protein [Pseudomonadota bacterium]